MNTCNECQKEFKAGPGCKGMYCSRACKNVASGKNLKIRAKKIRLETERLYYLDPKICKCGCGEPIPFKGRYYNQYVNSSHSCRVNNLKRGKQTSETIRKRLNNTASTKNYFKEINGFNEGAFFKVRYVNCNYCKKLMCQSISYPKKTCSLECRHNINVNNAYNGKRSKDEQSLFEKCKSLDDSVKSNELIYKRWDSDIVFPNQKIAIAWNGPWHYQQMNMNGHNLQKCQTRDKSKRKMFKNLGWKVLIFEDRYWTPETAFEVIRNLTA